MLTVQSDPLEGTDSVVVRLFTSHEGKLRSRLPFAATAANGLREHSDLMADKIMALPRERLGKRIGRASEGDMARVDRRHCSFSGSGDERTVG